MTENIREPVGQLVANIKKVISVDTRKLEYIIASKIAGGHVILADFHGVGKTSLARALAGSIRWHSEDLYTENVKVERFSRIQCTVDLLPQDILGYNRFVGSNQEIVLQQGPDLRPLRPLRRDQPPHAEDSRQLPPGHGGAERQHRGGKPTTWPDPFFIIATMNLKGVHLFPLPAPQLDRFMIRLSLGYPSGGGRGRDRAAARQERRLGRLRAGRGLGEPHPLEEARGRGEPPRRGGRLPRGPASGRRGTIRTSRAARAPGPA